MDNWLIYIYTYTLQIQNRSFSRVCSNTWGLHTHKTRGFPKPYNFWSLMVVFPFFFLQNSPFLHVRHSWPWVGWHNHACYPIQIPNGDVFSADAPSQITFKPLKIQWNLNHLNPYKNTGWYGFSTGSVRVSITQGFCKDLGFSQKYYGLVRAYCRFSTGWVRVWSKPELFPIENK